MGEGSKYQATKGETCAQIAKRIRKDIKAIELPEGVTVQVVSDYNSIGINVRGLSDAQTYLPQDDDDRANFRRQEYTPVAQKLIDELTTIHHAYNYDNSDIQSDYFDVRYYGRVDIESDWHAEFAAGEKAKKAIRAAELKAEKARAAAAPYRATVTDGGIGVYDKETGRRVALVKCWPYELRTGMRHSDIEYRLSQCLFTVVRYDRTKHVFDVERKAVAA